MADDIDLIIYDINLGWFNREVVLEHPSLLKLTNDYHTDFKLADYNLTQPEDHEIVYGENWLRHNVLNHWKLYHHRIL